jgi:hypothetical protein
VKNDKQVALEYHENTTLAVTTRSPTMQAILTQFSKGSNLIWHSSNQNIVIESQLGCRINNDKQALEHNEARPWRHGKKQTTTVDSLNEVREAI